MNAINLNLYTLIGQFVFYSLILLAIIIIIVTLLIIYSFKTNKFLFPNFMIVNITLLEGFVKAFFKFIQMDDSIVDDVVIQLKNKISLENFKKIPFNKRAIFFPQCLRSTDCPAKLSPEGIQCINCGGCEIGKWQQIAKDMGYMVFIVPGSSFIKRIVRKYKPNAILGVGCKPEIKGGLDMCHTFGLPGLGIVLSKDGCVSTVLDWDEFYFVISLSS